ncbi:MAG: CopG family transcriptional regulator [Gaiellales bacterium]
MVAIGRGWYFARTCEATSMMMCYARIMKRTTVMLPDEVSARLRYEARRRGVSIAEVVREAVEQHLPGEPDAKPLSFVALGEGQVRDSERVDEVVRGAVRRKLGAA